MPYIKQEDRNEFERILEEVRITPPDNCGELNYLLTKICWTYLTSKGKLNYAGINEVMGVMSCAQQEFYRRVAAEYENGKIKANGDVY